MRVGVASNDHHTRRVPVEAVHDAGPGEARLHACQEAVVRLWPHPRDTA